MKKASTPQLTTASAVSTSKLNDTSSGSKKKSYWMNLNTDLLDIDVGSLGPDLKRYSHIFIVCTVA